MNRFIVPLTVLFLFVLDRLTKLYLPVQKYCNEGAAFGILQGQTHFLSIFSILVILALIIYSIKNYKELDVPHKLGIALILGGTAGNLYDRISYGYVIDFIDITIIDFPIFNLADVFINFGAGILLITLLFRK